MSNLSYTSDEELYNLNYKKAFREIGQKLSEELLDGRYNGTLGWAHVDPIDTEDNFIRYYARALYEADNEMNVHVDIKFETEIINWRKARESDIPK